MTGKTATDKLSLETLSGLEECADGLDLSAQFVGRLYEVLQELRALEFDDAERRLRLAESSLGALKNRGNWSEAAETMFDDALESARREIDFFREQEAQGVTIPRFSLEVGIDIRAADSLRAAKIVTCLLDTDRITGL